MAYLELDDGFRLYYERHGPEGAPAIVFAHGAGGNGMSWWQQVPAFFDAFQAVTFDHRAFGRSADIEDGPGRAAFGSDAVALLDALELESVHFVAHSMGARTAMGILRHDPQRFRSLIVSGSNAGCVDDRLRERKAELAEEGVTAGSLLSRALVEGFAEREPGLAHLYHQVRSINPPRPKGFLAPPPEMRNYRGSTRDRILECGMPLLWIVGAHDRVIPAELVTMSHELTPGSQLAVVPDTGHSAYFEDAATWNSLVRSFIEDAERVYHEGATEQPDADEEAAG